MKVENELAILGGQPAVTIPGPHECWPPPASESELEEICTQRQSDISIKGKSSIIKEFEDLFLEFLENKVRFGITFNSGTSALFAAYFALGVGEDDEVVGPALTFHAALSPVYLLKGNVVLVDIDPRTRCIAAERIEESITERTKVITVVHQWGHPADMDAILKIAEKYGLAVVEDCSHAHGSRYKGRPVGTFGDVAVFSLQAAKMIYAGEGGILLTNRRELHDRATLLGHYRDRSRDEIQNPDLQKLWVTGYGQKYRMSPLNAVVAKHSLMKFNERKTARHAALNYLSSRLEEISYLLIHRPESHIDMGAWYGFKPLYKKEHLLNIPCETFIKALRAEGVEAAMASAPVLASQPLYNSTRDLLFDNHQGHRPAQRHSLHNAEMVQEQSLSFPTFNHWPRDKQIIDQYIVALNKIQSNARRLQEYALYGS